MRKVVLGLVVLAFVFVAVYEVNNMNSENSNYADKIARFDEKTIVGEKLVFYDDLNDGSRCYYVIRFTPNGNYIMHCYYYLNTQEQYINLYTNLYDLVVDYSYENLMIRTVESSGTGTYNELFNIYQGLFNNGNYVVIY